MSIVNPANFSANYSYNEQYRRDIYTDNFRNVEHRGGLNYSMAAQAQEARAVQQGRVLAELGLPQADPGPQFLLASQTSVGVQPNAADVRGEHGSGQHVGLEPATDFEPIITPQVVKTWTWNRNYTVKYDLTQALKLDYQGTAQALILENPGLIPSEVEDPDGFNAYREKSNRA